MQTIADAATSPPSKLKTDGKTDAQIQFETMLDERIEELGKEQKSV